MPTVSLCSFLKILSQATPPKGDRVRQVPDPGWVRLLLESERCSLRSHCGPAMVSIEFAWIDNFFEETLKAA
jgi:hypothetical protein